MNFLAIDTSTQWVTVALSVNGDMLSEECDSPRQHTKLLLPMIERLLAQAQCKLAQLDGIVFGQGPGSFTGLRIACSFAKGLAYAYDLPLYPVSSLAAIAAQTFETENSFDFPIQVLAMMDARMNEVYWGVFTQDFTTTEYLSIVKDIDINTSLPIVLAGVGCEHYTSQDLKFAVLKQCEVYPRAKTMIHLVQQGKIIAVDAVHAMPSYIRDPYVIGDVGG